MDQNNHTKSTTNLWIDPPYRLRDHSVLLNIQNNKNNNDSNIKVHNRNYQYDPQSLWTSFCTHHWPDLLLSSTSTSSSMATTDDTNHEDDDDDSITIPAISKPIFASPTLSPSSITSCTTGITRLRNPRHTTGIPQLENESVTCRDDDSHSAMSATSILPTMDPNDDNTIHTANNTSSPSWHPNKNHHQQSHNHHQQHHLPNRHRRRLTSTPLAAQRLVNFDMSSSSFTTCTKTPRTTTNTTQTLAATTTSGTAHCISY